MVGKKQTRSESCFSSEIYLFCCVLFGFFICASLSLLSRLSFLFHSIHPHPKDDDDEDYETRMIIDKVFFFSLPPPPQHQLWGAMTVNTQRRTTIANQSTVLVLPPPPVSSFTPVDIIPLVLCCCYSVVGALGWCWWAGSTELDIYFSTPRGVELTNRELDSHSHIPPLAPHPPPVERS